MSIEPTEAEFVQVLARSVRGLQEAELQHMKATESLAERLYANEDRTIDLMHQVLYLKTALCLSWLAMAAFAIWMSSQ